MRKNSTEFKPEIWQRCAINNTCCFASEEVIHKCQASLTAQSLGITVIRFPKDLVSTLLTKTECKWPPVSTLNVQFVKLHCQVCQTINKPSLYLFHSGKKQCLRCDHDKRTVARNRTRKAVLKFPGPAHM